jgi:hypothetical protein
VQDVAVGGADGAPPVVQRSAGTDALAAPSRPQPFAHHSRMKRPAFPFNISFVS